MSIPKKAPKNPKVKKTLGDLLGDGQVKTGKAFLDERVQQAREQEIFALAATEEARMQKARKR